MTPHHLAQAAVDDDGLANDVGRAAEATLPEAVPKGDDFRRPWRAVRRG